MLKKFVAAVLSIALLFALTEKKICVEAGGEIIAEVDAAENLPLTIKFTHSVQKTPVIEELEFDGTEFILRRTKYKSQGVGLPFMESDGEFRKEGDWLVMDKMNRRINNLSLRTGTGTELTLNLAGAELKLYEKYPPGTKIDVKIVPLYQKLFK